MTEPKKVYLVVTLTAVGNFQIQGAFEDEANAQEFSRMISTEERVAAVDNYVLYEDVPTVYTHECRVKLATGEVVGTSKRIPEADPLTVFIHHNELIVCGSSEQDAKDKALDYWNKLAKPK
jgi:hypothetical protein